MEQVTSFAIISRTIERAAQAQSQRKEFSGLSLWNLAPDQVISNARFCECAHGNGNESTFMPVQSDEQVSVCGQGSFEAQTSASAQAAHDGLDLVHK